MKNKSANISGDTKKNLIEVALELFAVNGYKGVSTRQIVEKAEANISAITYYFGGKEGLYKAILESKMDFFEVQMGPIIGEIAEKQSKNVEEQKQLLIQLFDKYLSFIFSKGISQYVVLLLIREMNSPSSNFELFYTNVIGRMHKLFTKIVAAIFDRPEDDEEMILLTTTLIGQLLIFRYGKSVILKRLGKDDYDKETFSRIKKIILNNVELIINNWS